MKRMNRKIPAIGLAAALVITACAPAGILQAAAKPKLATKSISVKEKKSKTIKINKKNGFKISFVSKNKKVATVKKKKKPQDKTSLPAILITSASLHRSISASPFSFSHLRRLS